MDTKNLIRLATNRIPWRKRSWLITKTDVCREVKLRLPEREYKKFMREYLQKKPTPWARGTASIMAASIKNDRARRFHKED